MWSKCTPEVMPECQSTQVRINVMSAKHQHYDKAYYAQRM